MAGQFQSIDSATEPLLAYLATRFVTQRENLATEALAHILSRSESARSALTRTMRLLGADIPDGLTFRTQAVAQDQSIPDLVGEDASRKQWLIVEAKFWAGLTDAQPVKYLNRVKVQGGGTLVFLVPALRAGPIWQELLRRCREAEVPLVETNAPDGCFYAGFHPGASGLGLLSWRSLLMNILTALEQAGEHTVASDVRQLQGLCDREDSQAFLPLESPELTSGSIPRRLNQFCELVDDLTSRLMSSGIGDTTGLRPTSSKGTYGRYLRIHGIACLICFSARLWDSHFPTPIWLRVFGLDWKPDPAFLEELNSVAGTTRLFRTPASIDVPIVLPTGVERDQVLRRAEEQLVDFAELLRAVSPATPPASASDVPSDMEDI